MPHYERKEMDVKLEESSKVAGSYFNPSANLLPVLAETSEQFGKTGCCKLRKYIHTNEEGLPYDQRASTLTPWREVSQGLMFCSMMVCMMAMWDLRRVWQNM
jgi:phosphoribulokinase